MNIVIIEDEKIAADNLEHLLLKYDKNIIIKAKIDSVKNAIQWLSENNADLIFVDVHLADDLSFKIFEKVEIKTPLIFTTAYDQYAIRAFKLNSIDYLLKPIDKKELSKAIDKYKNIHNQSNTNIEALLKTINSQKLEYQKRFIVTSGEKIKSIPTTDIAYFYAQHKFVLVVVNNGDQHLINLTMEKIESIIDPELFYRINRQFIISFSAIKNMNVYSRGRVKITLTPESAEEAIVSIDKTERFKRWLNK